MAAGVANAMTEALMKFVKDSPKHLKRVHIVIFQAKLLPDFQEAVKKCKKISRNASGRFQCMKQSAHIQTHRCTVKKKTKLKKWKTHTLLYLLLYTAKKIPQLELTWLL